MMRVIGLHSSSNARRLPLPLPSRYNNKNAPTTIKCLFFCSFFLYPQWFIWMHFPMTFTIIIISQYTYIFFLHIEVHSLHSFALSHIISIQTCVCLVCQTQRINCVNDCVYWKNSNNGPSWAQMNSIEWN
jgi:hypothetical protein